MNYEIKNSFIKAKIKSFGADFKAAVGTYKLIFDMTKYSGSKSNPFFPEINVVFQIADQKLPPEVQSY